MEPAASGFMGLLRTNIKSIVMWKTYAHKLRYDLAIIKTQAKWINIEKAGTLGIPTETSTN